MEAYKRNDLQSVERIVQNFPDPKYAHVSARNFFLVCETIVSLFVIEISTH